MTPRARRSPAVLASGAAAVAGLLWPLSAGAQTEPAAAGAVPAPLASAGPEVRQAIDAFARGVKPKDEGLALDAPEIADNPTAVPVRASVTRPISAALCARNDFRDRLNPSAVACAVRYTPATGTAEAGVRIRLAKSKTVRVLADDDGEVLHAARRSRFRPAAAGCERATPWTAQPARHAIWISNDKPNPAKSSAFGRRSSTP